MNSTNISAPSPVPSQQNVAASTLNAPKSSEDVSLMSGNRNASAAVGTTLTPHAIGMAVYGQLHRLGFVPNVYGNPEVLGNGILRFVGDGLILDANGSAVPFGGCPNTLSNPVPVVPNGPRTAAQVPATQNNYRLPSLTEMFPEDPGETMRNQNVPAFAAYVNGSRPGPHSRQQNAASNSSRSHWSSEGLSQRQLERRRELGNAYPLKLVQQVVEADGQMPPVGIRLQVYRVLEFVRRKGGGPTTTYYIGNYTTVQSANERLLDLWERKYGTEMFKVSSEGGGAERTELPDELQNQQQGGVPAKESLWEINGSCLKLVHRDKEYEKCMQVQVFGVRDEGLHE
ncbi:hypothetical protein GGR50DRAFT_403613 [Xylaria sp. CBS 124048]|nr:hypothetical protein GGR50DRAFT_403613 [Xylaria sp. CBS 124048]